MKQIFIIFIKLVLSAIVVFVTILTYVIAIEFLGHGLISALISPLGLFLLIPIWKKHANFENSDVINNIIKKVSTTEKFVFILLLVFISSVLKAMGMNMSFTISLILIGIIFFIYKMITLKTISDGNSLDSIKKREVEPIKFITNKKKNTTYIFFMILLLISALFYWYEIRPSRIISNCENFARSSAGSEEGLSLYEQLVFVGDYQDIYKSCLRSKGLEK